MRRVGLTLSVMAALLIVAAGVAVAASVLGTKGDDTYLHGGSEKDIVVGAQGSDNIEGRNEADQLYADSGSDTVKGGQGDDYIEGGRGPDTLNGEAGNDYINAVDGVGTNDKVDGGDGTNDACVYDKGDTVTNCEQKTEVPLPVAPTQGTPVAGAAAGA